MYDTISSIDHMVPLVPLSRGVISPENFRLDLRQNEFSGFFIVILPQL